MAAFLFRKLWQNKWLVICLLVGNILLLGISSASPLYKNATMHRMLVQEMESQGLTEGRYPAIMSLSYDLNRPPSGDVLGTYYETRDILVPEMLESLGVASLGLLNTHIITSWNLIPAGTREDFPRFRAINLVGLNSLESHITIGQGRLPEKYPVDGHIIEALTTETTMIHLDLLIGELLEINNVTNPETTYHVRIVGTYAPAESMYWSVLDLNLLQTLLIHEEIITKHLIADYHVEFRTSAHWHHILDYNDFSPLKLPHYINVLSNLHNKYDEVHTWQFNESISPVLEAHAGHAGRFDITLWVLQVPMYVLLALYIYMVSHRILLMEEPVISIIKSRGASRLQILGIYAMQGVFIHIISFPAGIALGYAICNVLGAADGFLELTNRAALNVALSPDTFLFTGIAALLSLITMMAPVISYSKATIVEQKRDKHLKGRKKAVWKRFYLDFVCMAVAAYSLYSFNREREVMSQVIRQNNSVDPLLFAGASLMIIGLGLVCLRLYPFLVKLVFTLARGIWRPSLYAPMLKIIRSAGEEQFIMIFLVFTVAVGIFGAQAARTINLNNDHQINYLAGGDLVFGEYWFSNMPSMPQMAGETSQSGQIVYYEPDYERFASFDEVESQTKVQRQKANLRTTGVNSLEINLMGIEADTFGKTSWFRDDLLAANEIFFLNALAENPEGALLSDNFRVDLGYQLGQTILIADDYGNTARLEVVGFVYRWPGFKPVERSQIHTGEIIETRQYLVVANLGHMQTSWGVRPYQVWMRTNTETNRFFYEFREASNLVLTGFYDTKAEVADSRRDPVLQGINGVLTVGFIVALLICFVGFLIYWIISIKSRVLQFGVFRAMGMTAKNLMGLLLGEQLLITFTALAIGAAVGEVSARLFVPLIQISYSAADQVIPLMLVNQPRDYLNLYAIISGMILFSLVILGVYVSRIKIAQALRLGED